MRLEIRNRIENIRNKNIPIGYKKVVRFIIPNAWEFIKIGEIAKQVSDLNNENKNYNVLSCTKYNGLVDSLRYFKKQIFSNDLNKYKKVHYNYFAYATNHIDEGSIGLQELYDVGLVSPMYTVFKTKEVVNKYLYALLKTENYRRIYKTMMSASVDRRGSLRWKDFSKIRIPFPPYHEQQKMAEIISTCDKIIKLKEKLIEQKKLQKKYLMQALLDPKSPNFRRLPGFDKDWKEVKLGSLGKTYGGLNGKNKNDFGTGKPYIPYVNIFNNPIINVNSFEYVEIGKNENQNRVKSGDVFFTTSSETPEEVGMSSVVLENIGELYLNSFCFGFRLYDFSKLNPNFAVYFFRSKIFREILNKLAQGSTRFNLSKNNMMKTNIILPTIKEQTAIAKILSTVEEEIHLLEKELEQQKLKKKALMQLLLTGKVRVNIS